MTRTAAVAVQRMAGRSITVLAQDPGRWTRKTASRVIFACSGNKGRSQMAAAFFNQEADPQRARAISAGATPSGTVEPNVLDVMRETGVDLTPSIPRRLNAPLATTAGHLVNMDGDDLPFFVGVQVEEWPIDDPNGQPAECVREIRDEIRRRVKQMIDAHGWGRGE
jgi:protein-tyrosine-phosphatase